jgi:hypothetical protein
VKQCNAMQCNAMQCNASTPVPRYTCIRYTYLPLSRSSDLCQAKPIESQRLVSIDSSLPCPALPCVYTVYGLRLRLHLHLHLVYMYVLYIRLLA